MPASEPYLPFPERRKSQSAFEALISVLSSRFINLPPGEVDREIEDSLKRVCELLGIDVAVLWQWSDADPGAITPTHFFPGRSGPRPFEPLDQQAYPWVVQQIREGRIVALSSMDELPPEAAVDRNAALVSGIRSNLTLPLLVGGERPLGALALNTLAAARDWSDLMVDRLQLVAQIFANALVRRRADHALRESEEVSRATFDLAAVGIAHVAIDGRWLRVNDKLCAIAGYSREELLRSTFQDITHPDDLAADLGRVRRLLDGEIKTFSMEKRYVRKDSSLVWIHLTVSLARNAAGEPRHFISVLEDITDRRRGEEALLATAARLAASADLARLAFYEVDLAEEVASFDGRCLDILGVPDDGKDGLGPVTFWAEHLHPDDRPHVSELRQHLHSGAVDRLSVEYRYLHPRNGERWLHHVGGIASRDGTGRAVRTFGVLRDVTERKLNEGALRDLSRRLIQAHEEERALLARELHDDLTQRIAVLAIDIGRAELAAAGGQAETLRAVREGLVSLSEDVHSLAYQLHPSVLEELGLAEALRTECERLGRQSNVVLSVELDSSPDGVGKDAALCLFRVAQEALNNVFRHALASAVSVALRRMGGGLLLSVRDDGIGFDPASPRTRKSLGLASMRERVSLVNGTLDVESAPGQGTSIVAWVPAEGESR